MKNNAWSKMLGNLGKIKDLKENKENENDNSKEVDVFQTIEELNQKNLLLEMENQNLKKKLESNSEDKKSNKKMWWKLAFIGMKNKFKLKTDVSKVQSDSAKIAEIIKQKDDLQEINEKMIDMLTEKEIENETLNHEYEQYKVKAECQNVNNLEEIEYLKNRIQELQASNKENQVFDVLKDYDEQMDNFKKQITDYENQQKELLYQINDKDQKIDDLNRTIKNMEMDYLSLSNKIDDQDKINMEGINVNILLEEENKSLKMEIRSLKDTIEKKRKEIEDLEEDQIKQLEIKQQEMDRLKGIIENKAEEIEKLETQNNSLTIGFREKNSQIIKIKEDLDEEKRKNTAIEEKLKKNTKELIEMKDYYNKFKTNNEKSLKEYEEKLDEIRENNKNLLQQNKELLAKIKENNTEKKEEDNLADILEEEEEREKQEKLGTNYRQSEEINYYKNENKLLTEEIKGLKEELSNNAHALIELDNLEKNLEKLKMENDELSNENKELKNKLEKEKQNKLEKKDTLTDIQKQDSSSKLLKTFRKVSNLVSLVKKESSKVYNAELDKIKLQQDIELLKKLNKEAKEGYEKQIENLKNSILMMKIKYSDMEMEKDKQILKYQNTFKAIINQCKSNGIKMDIKW